MDSEPAGAEEQSDVEAENRETEGQDTDEEDYEDEEGEFDRYVSLKQAKAPLCVIKTVLILYF